MWRLCNRQLNVFLNAFKPFTKRSTEFGKSLLTYRRFLHTPKFIIGPVFPMALSFLVRTEKKDEPKSINDKPYFKKIIRILKEGKYKELIKEYDEAEELYHNALELLYKLVMDKIPTDTEFSQTKAYIFDLMANLSMHKNDFDNAEKLFKEVLKELIINQKYKSDDDAIVEISLKLAMIYAAQQKYDNARAGYTFCLDAMEKKLFQLEDYMAQADDNSLALYGVVSEAYSKFLHSQNKWNESLQHLNKSFLIVKKVFKDAHPQIAVISNDLGVTFSNLKNNEEALKHLEFAADIGKQCSSPDLPVILYNLGDLLRKMNDTEKAKETFKLALNCCNKETSEEIRNQILFALDSESDSSGAERTK